MKPGAGKRKGSSWELQTARNLSLWLTEGKDKTQLIRSVLSGGWSARKGGKGRQVGDLASNGPRGEEFRRHFVVECKHHRDLSPWQLLTAGPGQNLLGWWLHLEEEARDLSETEPPTPLLLFRVNYQSPMVGTYPWLLDLSGAPRLEVWRRELLGQGFGFIRLRDFLRVSPERYYQAVREGYWEELLP